MATRNKTVYLLQSSYGSEVVSTYNDLDDYILLGTCEAEFVMVDPAEVTLAHIARLEAAKQKELADSYLRVKAIDEKIQSLLAITHDAFAN